MAQRQHRAADRVAPRDPRTRRKPAPEPTPAADAAPEVPISDVWSRTGTKYRTRAVVLLIANLLLFVGLGCFAYWLRTGLVFGPIHPGYWSTFAETFHPSPNTTISLSSLLTYPINVQEVPMQIVILGLELAALVSVPILVSILYRFPAAVPFLLVVGFVAMMPWLAITLTGACILASVRPFRFQFRYASALLGLLLVVVYFYMASRRAGTLVELFENPADRIKLMAPWILAVVGSCLLMAFVLLIARMVNYRPGAIAPLLAVMFICPVALFEFYVGRDELHYRILEHDYGPGSPLFTQRNVSAEFEHTVALDWLSRPEPRPDRDVVEDTVELLWLLELDAARYRYETVRQTDWFCRQFPDSRYAVNVLYLKGIAQDLRPDQAAFRRDRTVRFYSNFPSSASRNTWMKVLVNGPGTPMAAVARHRLAVLDARQGRIDSALAFLRILVDEFDRPAAATPPTPASVKAVLGRKPVERTLGIPLDHTVLEARRLKSLLENNEDPLYGYAPIIELLHFDPRDERYRDNLQRLLDSYPASQITDNVALEIARATPDAERRIDLMVECTERHRNGDALAETYFRLGEACLQTNRPTEALEWYQRIVSERPDSFWRRQAERLGRLQPVAPPAAADRQGDP